LTSDRKGFDFGILIHGGASVEKIKRTNEITRSLKSAVSYGFDLLKRNSSNNAVDSVEAAVASMEDSGVFDAGLGAYLTIDKTVEMDASIMDGKDISAGSVGMATGVKNPIKLARQIMERIDHVMIVSDGVTKLLKLFGNTIEEYPHELNEKKLNEYNKLLRNVRTKWKKNSKLMMMPSSVASQEKNHQQQHYYSTVGAVAIDRDGNVASAVSSGGIWLKMRGRIGDSAIIGSGIYADNKSGAACATGYGEYIMRLCLCKYACDQMQSQNSAHLSSKKSIEILTRRFGKNTGGIITVDTKGRFGIACNTRSMPTSMITNKNQKPIIAFGCS
jgi:L-asparaginase / beta-aspartyl-peptidase